MSSLRARIAAWLHPPLESFPDAPEIMHIYRLLASHPDLKREPGGWRYKERFYPDYLTVGGASHAIFREALKYCKGEGVDIGAGFWPLPGAAPLDLWRGPGRKRSIRDVAPASQDYVFSSHCLEHIVEWQAELEAWIERIKPGGVLFLYLPHPDCGIWEPGAPMVGKGHVWAPTLAVVRAELERRGLTTVASDAGPDAMQSFFICARK